MANYHSPIFRVSDAMVSEYGQDDSVRLQDEVLAAIAKNEPLSITAGNSKSAYGHKVRGRALDVNDHHGLIFYDPAELVLSVRAGTRLKDIHALLEQQGQWLPFDPPSYNDESTIGGAIATGLSGPGKQFFGGVRDYLLGVRIINGRGELLTFGGRVMKNVAGFDCSRLMIGAQGTLGVLLDLTLKVLPRPRVMRTVKLSCNQAQALGKLNQWRSQGMPITAACHFADTLYLRLANSNIDLSPSAENADAAIWSELRDHKLPFFQGSARLWRLLVPATAHVLSLPGECLLDWGGMQRWISSTVDAGEIVPPVDAIDGSIICLEQGNYAIHPQPSPPRQAILQALKEAFDPRHLLNPYRLNQHF